MKIIEICAIDATMKSLLGELNAEIKSLGHDLICVCSKGKNTKKLRDDGFNVINLNIDRSFNPLFNIISLYNLYKLFKKEKPDIVHVHTPVAAVLGRIAAKKAKVPIIIYTAHGFYFHKGMPYIKYNIILKIEKYLAKHYTDFIFTQSEEDKRTALENNFIDKSKILTIGNGVDVWGKFNPINIEKDKINRLYKEFNLNKNNKIVTFIGRLVKEKGVIDLLEAYNNINFNDGKKVKLLIIGDVAQNERDKDTKKRLEKYRNKSNVIFTGYRNDINSILYLTDVFCLPSYREGMPRTIIESMAMECAIIATDIRGSREEVVDGKTGFLIPINSINILADQIKELIEDEKLLKEMKIAGRKRAKRFFNEKEIVKKQLEVFKKLLNLRQKRH
jgi:glycosyltransferase involved in cell wall biosynthesis